MDEEEICEGHGEGGEGGGGGADERGGGGEVSKEDDEAELAITYSGLQNWRCFSRIFLKARLLIHDYEHADYKSK